LAGFHLEIERPVQSEGVFILGMGNQINTMGSFALLKDELPVHSGRECSSSAQSTAFEQHLELAAAARISVVVR
jgi:hypothetical protein